MRCKRERDKTVDIYYLTTTLYHTHTRERENLTS